MKINLTKKQYQLLMERCYIADWVINAYREKAFAAGEEQQDLLKYLLSYAKEFGYEDNVAHLTEAGANIWAEDYLDKNPRVEDFLRFYDYNRFADILSDKLAGLALEERFSQEELEAMDPKDISEEFFKLKAHALNTSSLMPGNGTLKEEEELEKEK